MNEWPNRIRIRIHNKMYIYKRYVEKLNKEYNGDDVNDYEEQWRWDYVIENKERKMRIEIGNQQTIK